MIETYFFIFQVVVTNFGNPLPDRVPGKKFSYSDHNAVSVQLHMKPTCTAEKRECADSQDTEFHETCSQAIQVCKEAMADLSSYKTLYLTIGGVILMFLIGTVGYWPTNILFDIIKIFITGLCFYYLIMGSVWYKIETNCLKAGMGVLENLSKTRIKNQMRNN